MIVRMTGFEGKLVWQTDKPNGQPRRGLDVSRAKEYFGWSAQVPFEEGMRRTIEWFKENRDKDKVESVEASSRNRRPRTLRPCND